MGRSTTVQHRRGAWSKAMSQTSGEVNISEPVNPNVTRDDSGSIDGHLVPAWSTRDE
jgi:hypothetical protein